MFLLPRTASPIPEFLYAENPDSHNFCGFLYRDYQSSPSDNPFPLSLSQSYLLSDILFVSLPECCLPLFVSHPETRCFFSDSLSAHRHLPVLSSDFPALYSDPDFLFLSVWKATTAEPVLVLSQHFLPLLLLLQAAESTFPSLFVAVPFLLLHPLLYEPFLKADSHLPVLYHSL